MNDITPETQAVIDGIKIAVLREEVERQKNINNTHLEEHQRLYSENERLKEGGCRQNCRTNKTAYIAGWNDRDSWLPLVFNAEESYKAWKDE